MRSKRSLVLAALALGAAAPRLAVAFDIDGGWPNGSIEMKMQLDAGTAKPAIPGGSLQDGNTSWNAAAEPGLSAWNPHLQRGQFTWTREGTLNAAQNNSRNDVFFASTIYGDPFGSRVLAVTTSRRAGIFNLRFLEADVIFNTGVSWNSYRGNLQSATDIQRVAMHEFGHVLGLNHPDQATPAQSVTAIMNSTISNIAVLQNDDISGASNIYASTVTLPSITTNLTSLNLVEAGSGALTIGLDGGVAPRSSDVLQYAWLFTPTGGQTELLFTIPDGTVHLGAAQLDDVGSYSVQVETPLGEVSSSTVSVAVSAVTKSSVTRLANLSTRGIAGTGDRALIVGFVITGPDPRRVLVRAVGPTLAAAPFNVSGAVTDPTLSLINSSSVQVASNDDWQSGGNSAELQAAFTQAGAFDLLANSADAAVVVILPPGAYTAPVTSKTGVEGLVLVEAYDLDSTANEASRLSNLSTRAFVGTGEQIVIAGFVVNGPGPRRYLLRAAGDTLGTMGISGFLDDTTLDLYNAGTLLRKTDDWDSPEFLQPTLTAAFNTVGAFQFTDRQESALLLTLNPGDYTLHLAGFEGSTGIAIVEIYEMPN